MILTKNKLRMQYSVKVKVKLFNVFFAVKFCHRIPFCSIINLTFNIALWIYNNILLNKKLNFTLFHYSTKVLNYYIYPFKLLLTMQK